MTEKSELTLWQKNWQKNFEIVSELLPPPDDDPSGRSSGDTETQNEKEWYEALTQHLAAFTDDRKKFFLANPEKIQKSPDYPIDFILRNFLDQFSFDLSVIERACHQRETRIETETVEKRKTLYIADQLAINALIRAEGFQIKNTIPITYFQKTASVRVIPYSNAALIGIPFTSIENRNYLLAIAHEVGHHVYWHGKIKKTPIPNYLANRFRGSSNWLLNWLEEIFSDVYGAIVAGPVMALSFLDLLLSQPVKDFAYDDGAHPIPWLRIWVYYFALKKLFPPEADDVRPRPNGENLAFLKGIWDYHQKSRKKGRDRFNPYFDGQINDRLLEPEFIEFEDAYKELEKFIPEIIDVFEENKVLKEAPGSETTQGYEPWSKWISSIPPSLSVEPKNEQGAALLKLELNKLYKQFYNPNYQDSQSPIPMVNEILKSLDDKDIIPSPKPPEKTTRLDDNIIDFFNNLQMMKKILKFLDENNILSAKVPEKNKLLDDTIVDFFNNLQEEIEPQKSDQIPPSYWLPIFAAGGWTLKGPETEPVIG